MLFILDNYDSFTYNLVQRLGEIDPAVDVRVFRNDQISLDEIARLGPGQHHWVNPGIAAGDHQGRRLLAGLQLAEEGLFLAEVFGLEALETGDELGNVFHGHPLKDGFARFFPKGRQAPRAPLRRQRGVWGARGPPASS